MPKVMSILRRFLPLYDESSAPPAFPSLLTDQLELFGHTHHSLTVEILPPNSKSVVRSRSLSRSSLLCRRWEVLGCLPSPNRAVLLDRLIRLRSKNVSDLKLVLGLTIVRTRNPFVEIHLPLWIRLQTASLRQPLARRQNSRRSQSLLASRGAPEEEGITLNVPSIGMTRSTLSSRSVCFDTIATMA
jgi:hypothetical protein